MSARGRDGGEAEPMEAEDLVSLLYGELEPDAAERAGARVAADPVLSARLGEMRRVRELFGALEDEEPPARLTAQLMAEAARSAPQARKAAAPPEAGFWARFVSWLQPIVQRPALAAAASLVLVAGVAGVLYLKKGEELTSTAPPPAPAADSAASALEGTATGTTAEPTATPPPAAAEPAQDPTGAAAGDDDEAAAEAPAAKERSRGEKQVARRSKAAEPADRKNAYQEAPARPAVKSGTVYGLSEQEMVPRDQAPADTGKGGGAVGGAASDPSKADAPAPQAPPPPPAPTTAPAEETKAAPRPNVRDLHKRAVDAALDNRCSEVKMLAGQVRGADATYYARSFATDARLQKCLASPSRAPAKK